MVIDWGRGVRAERETKTKRGKGRNTENWNQCRCGGWCGEGGNERIKTGEQRRGEERAGRDNQKTDWGDQGETKEEVRGRNKGGGGQQRRCGKGGREETKERGCLWVGLQKPFGTFGAGRGGGE